MRRVFVSYAYNDREAHQCAHFLYDKLPTLGVEPLNLFDDFATCSNWQMDVTEQINKCSIFVCFIERDNPNIMFELGYALAKNKKIILVGDFKDLPTDFSSMLYIPRASHPYELLMQIEKCISYNSGSLPSSNLDLSNPNHTIHTLVERPELLDSLDAREFEQLVLQWFSARGYMIGQAMFFRDYGYDFLIHPFKGERAAVEVKKYKSTSQVPVSVVRQLVGSMTMERIPYGIVVSTAPFTNSVKFFVQDLKPTIFLWTLDDLVRIDGISNEFLESDSKPIGTNW